MLVDDDVEEAILREVEEYDVVCVGAARSTGFAQAIFGSIPKRMGEHASGTVVIVRRARYKPRTMTEALVERLGGRRPADRRVIPGESSACLPFDRGREEGIA